MRLLISDQLSSNLGPNLHHFGDTAASRTKVATFLDFLSFNAFAMAESFEFLDKSLGKKL